MDNETLRRGYYEAMGGMSTQRPRYTYGRFKTQEKAEAFLEDMWAAGDVGSLEQPKIERQGKIFAITLLG